MKINCTTVIITVVIFQAFVNSAHSSTCAPTPRRLSFFEGWEAGKPYKTLRYGQDFLERNSNKYPLRIFPLKLIDSEAIISPSSPSEIVVSYAPSTSAAQDTYAGYNVRTNFTLQHLGCGDLGLIGRAPASSFSIPEAGLGDERFPGGLITRSQLQDQFYYEWTLCEKKSKKYCRPYDVGLSSGASNRIKLSLPWNHTINSGAASLHRSAAICDALVNRLSWMIFDLATERQKSHGESSLEWQKLDLVKAQISSIDQKGSQYFSSSTSSTRFQSGLKLCRAKLSLLSEKFLHRSSSSKVSTKLCSNHGAEKLMDLSRCMAIEIDSREAAIKAEYDEIVSYATTIGIILAVVPSGGTSLLALGATATTEALAATQAMVTLASLHTESLEDGAKLATQRFVVDQTRTLVNVGFIDKSDLEEEGEKLLEEQVRIINDGILKGLSIGLAFNKFYTSATMRRIASTTDDITTALAKSASKWKPIRLVSAAEYRIFDRNLASIMRSLSQELGRLNRYPRTKKFIEEKLLKIAEHNAENLTKKKARESLRDMALSYARDGIIELEVEALSASETQQISALKAVIATEKRLICEAL